MPQPINPLTRIILLLVLCQLVINGSVFGVSDSANLAPQALELCPTARFRVGTAYDYLSETYHILDTAQDSFSISQRLNQEFLNQPQLFVEFTSFPWRRDAQRINVRVSSSRDFLRSSYNGSLKVANNSCAFTWASAIDTRARVRGQAALGDEYVHGDSRLRFQRRLNERLIAFVQSQGEFDNQSREDSSSLTQDYHRLGAKAGFDIATHNFDNLFLNAAIENRRVRYDQALDYSLWRVETGYDGFSGASFYTFAVSHELRDYKPAGDVNDQRYTQAEISGHLALHSRWSVAPRAYVEYTAYRIDTSLFNRDQYRLTVETRITARLNNGLTIGMGPRCEILNELAVATDTTILDGDSFSEEYTELAAVMGCDYFRGGTIIVSAENTIGRTNAYMNTDFLADNIFDRLSAYTLWRITRRLEGRLLGSIHWEWGDHNNPAINNDNAFYFMSVSLSYEL